MLEARILVDAGALKQPKTKSRKEKVVVSASRVSFDDMSQRNEGKRTREVDLLLSRTLKASADMLRGANQRLDWLFRLQSRSHVDPLVVDARDVWRRCTETYNVYYTKRA